MLQKPNQTKSFAYKPEAGQNPYCGIVSFQHFRDEALYSDAVVKPENNMCETENFEGYPVPEYVPQNGRSEGYYPDTSIAYIRIFWKEFEPEQGVFNYAFIEDILNKAQSKSQTVMLRLMAHSTRAADDVPEWLKGLIPCPERPAGKRVKESPTDPLFLKLFGNAVRKLGERFDSNPVLDVVDVSDPGAWGEGCNLHLYSEEDKLALINAYIEAFPNTQLLLQYRHTNILKERTDLGWRGDGYGDPFHVEKRYPPIAEQLPDCWKTAPVSFESYWWLPEWHRRGWDIDKIIQTSLDWHITSFNPKSIPVPYEWEDKVKNWVAKMGYHYTIHSFAYPEKAMPADTVQMVLDIENVGVAPSYHKTPLYVKLRGEKEYVFETDVDIRKWMPGKHSEQIHIEIPADLKTGAYSIEVSIYNDLVKNVYFATDAAYQDGWYKLGEIKIG